MVAWLVDNISTLQVLLGLVALGFGAAFYLTKRVKFLGFAALMVLVIVILGFLPRVYITDRKQLELNVREMADAVATGKADLLRSHLTEDFDFNGRKRAEAVKHAIDLAKANGVTDINIWGWEVEKIDRAEGTAQVWFGVSAEGKPYCRCRAYFRLIEDHWKMHKIEVFNLVAGQDVPMQL